jgi:hypothetical protein
MEAAKAVKAVILYYLPKASKPYPYLRWTIRTRARVGDNRKSRPSRPSRRSGWAMRGEGDA